jgi:TRAP-type mannitol/chloroaromatic compound transport system permease small subunit
MESSGARPPGWLRPATAIDRLNELVGSVLIWLLALMVVIGAFNAIARYMSRFIGINLSSNAYIELQWYLFSLIFLLGAAWALKHDAHVRVDLLYERIGTRGRAWVDLLGTVVFLIPFSLLMLLVSYPSIAASWRVREVSPDPGGLPRYPIKAAVLVAFVLLLLQGIAQLLKQIAILRNVPVETEAGHHLPEEV